MEALNPSQRNDIAEAVLIWTGWQHAMFPRRKYSFLVERFGEKRASELFTVVRSLEDDFYLTDAKYIAADLVELGQLSREQFAKKHPDLPVEIGRAFSWCYTFENK